MSWNRADVARIRRLARDEEDLRALLEMPVVEREEELERRHNKIIWSSNRSFSIPQRPGPTQLDLGLAYEEELQKETSESSVDEDEDEESEPNGNFIPHEPIEPQINVRCYQNVILPAQFLVMYPPQWFFEELIRKHAMFLLRLDRVGSDILSQYSRDILIPVRVSPDMWQSDANSTNEVYRESREHIYDSYLANPDISRYYIELTFPEELQKKRIRVSCADLVSDENQYDEVVLASSTFTDSMLRELMEAEKSPYKALTYASLIESGQAIRAITQSIIGNKPERDYVSSLIKFECYIIKALSSLPNIRINQIHMRMDTIHDNEKQILLNHHVKIADMSQDELEARYSENSKRHLAELREELAKCEESYRTFLTKTKEINRTLYNTTTALQSNIEFACFSSAGPIRQLWQKTYKELQATHSGDQYAERLASLRKQLALDTEPKRDTLLAKTLLMSQAIDNLAINSVIIVDGGFFTIEKHEDLGSWPLLGPRYRIDILGEYAEASICKEKCYFCHRYNEEGQLVLKFARQPV